MTILDAASSKTLKPLIFVLVALLGVASLPSGADAEEFQGPSFRRGLWRFVRTLDVVLHSKLKHRLLDQRVTRCVDPTEAMKVTFSPISVGNCVSARPERVNNTYTFSNRCDYMGPVSTTIVVQSDEAYKEVNLLSVGTLPRRDIVTAQRIGDCEDDAGGPGGSLSSF